MAIRPEVLENLMNKLRLASGVIDYIVPYGTAGGDIKTLSTAQAITWDVADYTIENGRLILPSSILFEVTTSGATNVIGVLIINSGNTVQWPGGFEPATVINLTLDATGIEAPDDTPTTLETGDFVRVESLHLGIGG